MTSTIKLTHVSRQRYNQRILFKILKLEHKEGTLPSVNFYIHSKRQIKDQRRRKSFFNVEIHRQALRQLGRSLDLTLQPRTKLLLHSLSLSTSSYPSKLHLRCVLSMRPLGVFSHYKLSRIILKDIIEQGHVSGWSIH